jgi:hypothetical protein
MTDKAKKAVTPEPCIFCDGSGEVKVGGCTCGRTDIGVGSQHEPMCGFEPCYECSAEYQDQRSGEWVNVTVQALLRRAQELRRERNAANEANLKLAADRNRLEQMIEDFERQGGAVQPGYWGGLAAQALRERDVARAVAQAFAVYHKTGREPLAIIMQQALSFPPPPGGFPLSINEAEPGLVKSLTRDSTP